MPAISRNRPSAWRERERLLQEENGDCDDDDDAARDHDRIGDRQVQSGERQDVKHHVQGEQLQAGQQMIVRDQPA